jgi:hypothetical protein
MGLNLSLVVEDSDNRGTVIDKFGYLNNNIIIEAKNTSVQGPVENELEINDSDEELDEVIGYHFVNCTTLFVAYVYVNSGCMFFFLVLNCFILNLLKLLRPSKKEY